MMIGVFRSNDITKRRRSISAATSAAFVAASVTSSGSIVFRVSAFTTTSTTSSHHALARPPSPSNANIFNPNGNGNVLLPNGGPGSAAMTPPITKTRTALLADLGGNTGPTSNTNPSSASSSAGSRRSRQTAMESAILVEWEPISELERRLEDGIHYEHFPDFEHMFGSDEAMRLRKRAVAARDAREEAEHAEGGRRRMRRGGGGGVSIGVAAGDDADGNEQEEDNLERVQGVFAGFRVTREETERLRSANPEEVDYTI